MVKASRALKTVWWCQGWIRLLKNRKHFMKTLQRKRWWVQDYMSGNFDLLEVNWEGILKDVKRIVKLWKNEHALIWWTSSLKGNYFEGFRW